MKQIILGTAGHIDHGKTSLVKALTGTDTDRLKEEKQRGITIELGFASLDLPSGHHIGIVDVPGHEKFVKNMVAGASGIDLVVMVIAADEGVMPQTREHMEICALLGVKHGMVALTKVDMVDEEWLELVTEDVYDFMEGTFLEDAPIVPVSSATGQGLEQIVATLDEICNKLPQHTTSGLFRLPVDRVFSMKGFGTVITGTLISGKVQVGDTIMIYPQGIAAKVRGLQVHNQSVEIAESGMRTAINFQGLEKTAVNRGDVLAMPDTLIVSYMLDVSFQYLKSNEKALKNRTLIRFHSGTNEIMGYLILLDREELQPGDTALVQLRLDSPVALVKDDRYVIRSYSPVRTIGGGYVINPIPSKHKRFKNEIIETLTALDGEASAKTVRALVRQADVIGVSFAELKLMTNLNEKPLQQLIADLLSKKEVICVDKDKRKYVHQEAFAEMQNETMANLTAYHQKNPLKNGMPKQELKSKFPKRADSKLFNLILVQSVKAGEIVQEEDLVRLAGHKVSLKIDQTEVREKTLALIRQAGLMPPTVKDMSSTLSFELKNIKEVLTLLVSEGEIVKVKEDLYFDASAIRELKERLVAYLKAHEEIATPDFKQMTNASRKFVIPLIEYFDMTHVTIRVGDIRKLRA